MPVEKKGHKGVSPKVSQYYKVEDDKVSRERKSCARCGKGVFSCPNTRIEELVENVAILNLFSKVFSFVV